MTMKQRWGCIRFAFRLCRNHSRKIFVYTVLRALFAAALGLIPTVFSALLIQELTGAQEKATLLLYAVLLAGLTALVGFLSRLCEKAFHDQVRLLHDEEARLFEEYMAGADYELLEDKDFCTAVNAYSVIYNNNGGIFGNLWLFFYDFLYGCLSLAFSLGILARPVYLCLFALDGKRFITSPASTVLLLAAVLLLGGVMLWLGGRSAKVNNGMMQAYNNIYGIFAYWFDFSGNYQNGKEIRLYAAQPLIGDMQRQWTEDWLAMSRRLTARTNRYSSALLFMQGLLMGVLYLYVALKAGAGVFDVSSFALFLGGASMLASGIGGIGSVTMLLGTSAVQIGTFKQIVETPQRIAKGTLPVEKRDDNRYDIAFQNVSFCYPGSDTEVLHQISVRLRIGSHVAVVGENGSGKTTFIKLLCRLYDVSEGSITLNDIDIKKYDPREYRSLFSVVFQDYQLFAVPLAQNVASSLAIEDAKLWDCLEKAGIAERVRRLPQKEQTALYQDLDENGVEISGGEAQKLALARALYKDAPFVILDEPTAALDPIAEFEVYRRFSALVGDKTAVYISHRLSSCRFCDTILVFDKGRIVQAGSHEELLAAEGKYRDLWQAQAGYYGG